MQSEKSETWGVECTCFCHLFHVSLLLDEVTRNTCQTGVYTDLQQSLTEHYFLCKDTTVHIYYVEKKTLLEIGRYFFKVKIFKCKDTHGKDFSLMPTINEEILCCFTITTT